MQTKYGSAHLNKDGYYEITSKLEGNFHKLVHRLVFEEFYKIKLSPNIIIHHDDGDKTNNKIWNLIPLTKAEHTALHNKEKDRSGKNGGMWGKLHTKSTKDKQSEAHKGFKNPMAKYHNKWNISYVGYKKHLARENGAKCFSCVYNGRYVPIGMFKEFVSCEIIGELVKEALL